MTKLSNPNLLDIGVSEEMKGFINYNQTQMKKRIERIYENFLYKKKDHKFEQFEKCEHCPN